MKFHLLWFTLVCLFLGSSEAAEPGGATRSLPAASGFRQPDAQAHRNLFVWTDTCNVYVLRDGDAALLIDLGDGSVLDHLADLGVTLGDQRYGEWFDFMVQVEP